LMRMRIYDSEIGQDRSVLSCLDQSLVNCIPGLIFIVLVCFGICSYILMRSFYP